MAIARKQLLRHKGRSGGDSSTFARLPVEVLESPACVTLPHVAYRVLVAVAAQYSGRHNGSLSLTKRTALLYGIRDPHALGDSLRELEARGLIVKTRLGTHVPPRSAFFALGWLPVDEPLRHDPHELNSSLRAPDAWRTWRGEIPIPHWVTERRKDPRVSRLSMVRPTTSMGGVPPPTTREMDGGPPPIDSEKLVAGHAPSQILVGDRLEGRYPRVTELHFFHRQACLMGALDTASSSPSD